MTRKLKKDKNTEVRANKTVRLSKTETNQIQLKADVYAGGNVSKWMRYASLNCIPFIDDLEKEK